MAAKVRVALVARADTGGLASQTLDFYNWMKPHKTLVIDIEHLTHYPNDFSKFPGAQIAKGFEPSVEEMDRFLQDIDVVFTVECPYNHLLYTMARERGIKTVCQYNYEWLGHHPEPHLPKPDLFLAPSYWHINDMDFGVPVKYLHVPIDREKFPFALHTRAKKFLHIAGHRTHGDRNGTDLVLESLPFIKSDIEIIMRTQDAPRPISDHRMTIIHDDPMDNKDLFDDADVLILPRRYGGLSLQLNEALSRGMPVIMLDIEPQNEFLPMEWLVEAQYGEKLMIKTKIDSYTCKPADLAKKIDWFAHLDITKHSRKANAIASDRDWNVMKYKYEELFRELNHNSS